MWESHALKTDVSLIDGDQKDLSKTLLDHNIYVYIVYVILINFVYIVYAAVTVTSG
jgi:hypothetical protein